MMIETGPLSPFLSRNGKTEVVNLDELQALFIQNVSHELRTPLCAIQGYAELLLDGDLGCLSMPQARAVEVIVNRSHQLRTLVERIGVLLASRAHATVSIPVSVTTLAKEIIEERRAMATAKGLLLESHLETDLPLVAGDPYQLKPAFDCLLDNAIKFTSSGGRVELRTHYGLGWSCLAVIDTGIGFTKEEAKRIFMPFYQVDGSSTRRYGGMGLGLGLVKAVVEGHGGQIEVSSQPGQGSRFTVRLPAMSQVPEDAGVLDTDVWRILVVDDEENVALTIQDGLERLPNCEVAVSCSGEEALQLFEESPFDLLITDYKMPGTDGMTLAARVRQLYPRTSIVMITAYSSDLLYKQAQENAIRCILNKPVKLDEIRSLALEVLENRFEA